MLMSVKKWILIVKGMYRESRDKSDYLKWDFFKLLLSICPTLVLFEQSNCIQWTLYKVSWSPCLFLEHITLDMDYFHTDHEEDPNKILLNWLECHLLYFFVLICLFYLVWHCTLKTKYLNCLNIKLISSQQALHFYLFISFMQINFIFSRKVHVYIFSIKYTWQKIYVMC